MTSQEGLLCLDAIIYLQRQLPNDCKFHFKCIPDIPLKGCIDEMLFCFQMERFMLMPFNAPLWFGILICASLDQADTGLEKDISHSKPIQVESIVSFPKSDQNPPIHHYNKVKPM